MTKIHVGQNVVTINEREFPVDSDLQILGEDTKRPAWAVRSMDEKKHFTPVVDEQVTEQTFEKYSQSLQTSMAMNTYGKMNRLYNRKIQGVKIIPGHGVFTLPSKINVFGTKQNTLILKVFPNSILYRSFQNSNYHQLVEEAMTYYDRHIREVTDEDNYSLYMPVTIGQDQERNLFGIEIPRGVYVQHRGDGKYAVTYKAAGQEHSRYVGIAQNAVELNTLVFKALTLRSLGQQQAMMDRRVDAGFQLLSHYMQSIA